MATGLAAASAGVAARISAPGTPALEALGWAGREAEWIALVCLHSGMFTRAQYAAFVGTEHPETLWRFLGRLVERTAATQESWGELNLGPVPGGNPQLGVWWIRSREIYRALGVEHVRHRREASPAVLLRRLLSLDHVLDHLDLPWLPTEDAKVEAFESLGIDRALFPRRDYAGRQGSFCRRFFQHKQEIALGEVAATFVYADADDATSKGLGSWAADHRPLWSALREREIAVRVVIAARMHKWLTRAERVLARWQRGGGKPAAALAERRRVEEAISEVDSAVLAEYGGVDGALARLDELDELEAAPEAAGGGWIDTGTTWLSRRLAA